MTDRDFLLLIQKALTADTFIHDSETVYRARVEVKGRLATLRDCHRCNGLGWITVHDTLPMGGGAHNEPCPACSRPELEQEGAVR